MDSTWVLIGLQVCSQRYEARKWRAIWFDCLRVGEFTVRASYNFIVFLFVKAENNNFIKEIKHVVCASIACWKPRQSLWKCSSRWKPSTASPVFTDLLSNSPKRSPRFHQAMKARKTCYIS